MREIKKIKLCDGEFMEDMMGAGAVEQRTQL